LDLRGQPALVTGAAKRVGRAIALALAREDARVAVHFHTSHEEAEETARLIRAAGSEALLCQGDLADPSVPERLVAQVTEAWGDLAILVNSASIFEDTPWPVSDEAWARHLDINVTAPMRLIRAATPALQASGGAVINVADASWQRPTWRRHAAYCVSKVALVGLTQNLAMTLAPRVRVNAVAPGAILAPEDYTDEDRARAIRGVPLGRWGAPEDIAQAVVMLAKSDYITGQVLNVDGGRAVI
jgi:pteridine reductase